MTAVTTQGYVGVAGRNEVFIIGNNVPQNINASDGNDYINSYGSNDLLIGGLGKDLILGQGGNDAIYGDRSFNDEMFNFDPSLAAVGDALFGQSGSDTIFAGGGVNFVNGGADDDFILGGSGNEFLEGGLGNDTIQGGAGDDMLFGGTDTQDREAAFLNTNFGSTATNYNGLNDTAQSSSFPTSNFAGLDGALTNTGVDLLDGGAGSDILNGGDGADTMIGGTGNDSFVVNDAGDVVTEFEGQGTDEIYAGITLSLVSNVENVTFTDATEGGLGNALANRMAGNNAANFLNGAEGNDTLLGGANSDRLVGGADADVLTGGVGDDTFIYNKRSEGGDTITDFSSSGAGNDDRFQFAQAEFGGLSLGGLSAARFSSGIADGAANTDTRFFFETDTHILRYDPDGSATNFGAIVVATLQANANVTNADIFIA